MKKSIFTIRFTTAVLLLTSIILNLFSCTVEKRSDKIRVEENEALTGFFYYVNSTEPIELEDGIRYFMYYASCSPDYDFNVLFPQEGSFTLPDGTPFSVEVYDYYLIKELVITPVYDREPIRNRFRLNVFDEEGNLIDVGEDNIIKAPKMNDDGTLDMTGVPEALHPYWSVIALTPSDIFDIYGGIEQ